jgi:hypothetical protein
MNYITQGFERARVEKKNQPRLSVLQLLLVAFVCFKVLDLVDWSWWAVFIPLYISAGLEIIAGYLFALHLWLSDK